MGYLDSKMQNNKNKTIRAQVEALLCAAQHMLEDKKVPLTIINQMIREAQTKILLHTGVSSSKVVSTRAEIN